MVGEWKLSKLPECGCDQRCVARTGQGTPQGQSCRFDTGMNVQDLDPPATNMEPFRRSHARFVPDAAGCYVLTTFGGDVLYLGLSVCLRRRFCEHLDSPLKTSTTPLGKAVKFH